MGFNPELLFLIVLALIWIIGAILQDLKRREVDNIWNFSLIAFALSYRFFVSIFQENPWFFFNGIIGFFVFLILGNVFYYSRLFAGGDAKLLISLGTILPLSYDWIINAKIFLIFIIGFLVCGSIYALSWSLVLVILNFKRFFKEFVKQSKNYKRFYLISIFFASIWIILTLIFLDKIFLFIGLIIVLFPILFVFAKSVEESCMIIPTSPLKVTEGDWLYEDILVGDKRIKASWEGISNKELKLIQTKYKKKILIKQGIPFTPSFLFGFLIILFLLFKNNFYI
ncbi:MAG: prepilin peptidase [Candidatus Pacearchaeota archaeon]|jgi:Flp pilus assembly protein protease CpaA